jgi:hypothetical protein
MNHPRRIGFSLLHLDICLGIARAQSHKLGSSEFSFQLELTTKWTSFGAHRVAARAKAQRNNNKAFNADLQVREGVKRKIPFQFTAIAFKAESVIQTYINLIFVLHAPQIMMQRWKKELEYYWIAPLAFFNKSRKREFFDRYEKVLSILRYFFLRTLIKFDLKLLSEVFL